MSSAPRPRTMNARTEPRPPATSTMLGTAGHSTYITPSEWRWVVIASCLLTLLALLPLLWIAVLGVSGWQFMGVLHNYLDGATYFAKMGLGQNGSWLVTFMHTPETHTGAFIQVTYLLLGHLSRLSGVPIGVLYHLARVLAGLLMYAAIYQLGATIWSRVRPRRLFFGVAVAGAGFGWLAAPLTGQLVYPDFPLLPEAFPFFASLMNVHFPLAIAVLAMLVTCFIHVFRPGSATTNTLAREWPVASVLSVLLALLYPQALVPLGGALMIYLLSLMRNGQAHRVMWQWVLAVVLSAAPVALYYLFVVAYNPAMQVWNTQNQTPTPPFYALVIGFGLPLLIGLPAIWRALRRLERDGDRFMLFWLVIIVVAMYLPVNVQRRFAVGLMLPVAYFAVRAIEDVWLLRINRRWRTAVGVAFFGVISISLLLMLFLPAVPIVTNNPGQAAGVYLEADYASILNELNSRTTIDDVVLASPVVSAWLPGWGGVRSVYGHPYETLDASTKREQVEAWYAAETTADCADLIAQYDVRYVIAGPQEARLGSGLCLSTLRVMGRAGSVTLYAP